MKLNTLILALLFTSVNVSAQSITTINPNTGMPLEPLTVSITGQNTHFSQATNTVWFSQGSLTIKYPGSINIINDTEIEANITFEANYDSPIIYDVNVYNEVDYMLSLPLSFTLQTLPTPLIVSVSPDHANKPETLTVTISGENTHFIQATNTTVWFSQGSETIIPNYTDITNDTNIDAEFYFPVTSELGYYDINVLSEYDGLVQLLNGFYLNDMINIIDLNDTNITIYPNPSRGVFNINSKEVIESIQLIDIKGKLLNKMDVFSKQTTMNLSHLTKGVYFLQVNIQGKIYTKSIIIE